MVWLINLVELQETLNGTVKLISKDLFLLFSIELGGGLEICSCNWRLSGVVNALDSGCSLEVLVYLLLNLSKILVNILISSLKSLLGKFSYLSSHHALLILEEAV